MINKNFHAYPSFFTNESRIIREAEAIVDLNIAHQVMLFGLWAPGLKEVENIREGIVLFRIKTLVGKTGNSKLLNVVTLVSYFLKLFRFAIKERPEVINVHSLTVLPFGVIIKWFLKSKLIYDAHELETETHASKGIRKRIAKAIEAFFIRYVDYTIVVSESIRTWYQSKYDIGAISTIKNIPILKNVHTPSQLRVDKEIPDSALLFIYVGLFANGRGIQLLLDSFQGIKDEKIHLVFLGYGDLKSLILDNASTNIHCLPAVEPSRVASYVAGADIGLSIIENTCLSYYFSLPNKVFEYMAAGIPFVCSDFPDVRNEFDRFNVCWFVKSAEELTALLKKVTPDEILEKRKNVLKYRSNWDWQHEKMKLEGVFKNVISRTVT